MQQHNQHAQKGEGGVDISQPPSAILGDLSPVRRLHRKSTTTAAVSTSLCTPMTHQNQGLSKSTGSVSNNTSRKTAARPTSAISSRVVSATTSPTRAHNTTAARRRSTRPFVHRYHRRFVIPEDALAPTSIFSQQTASAKGQPRLETRFVSSQLTGDGLAKAERITQRDSRGRPTRLQGYITTGNPPPQSILDDDFRLGKRWDFHGARRGQGDSGLAGMVGEGGFVMRDPLRDDDSYFEMYRGEIEEQRAQEVLEEHERNRQEMIHHSPGTVKRRPPRGGGVGSMDSLIARNVAYLDADAVGAIDTNGELTHLTKYGVSAAVDDDTMEPTPLSRAAVIKRTVGIHDVSFGTVQSPTARSNYVVQLAESTRRQRSPGGMGGDVGKGAVVIPSPDGGDTGFMVPCALCNVVYSKQALKFRTTAKNIVRLHAEWEKQAEDEEYARRQASELSALMWNTTMMSTCSVDQSNVNSSAVSHVTSAAGNSEIDVDVGYSTAVEEINNTVAVTSPEESVREAPSPTHHSPTNSDVGKLGLHRLAGLSKRISVSFLGTSTLAEESGGGVGGGVKKPVRAASVSFPGPTASSSKPPLYERQSTRMSPSPSSTVSNTHIKDANTAAGAAQKHNKASNMYAPVWVCTFCGQFFGLYEGMCGGPQTLEDVNAALIDECRHLKRNRVARVKQSRKENQALNSRLHKELDTLKKELAMREELASKERHNQKQLTSTKCASSAASTGITRSSMPPGSPSLSVTIYGSVPDVGNLSLNREGADAFSSLNDQGSGAEGKQSASEEAVLSTLGLAGVVGGECTPVSLSTYPPLGDSSLGGAGSRGGGGGGGVSPATNAMGVSMANRARGASMRGGGSSGRFKAVVKSVFETMTMLGKSARGDLDFTRIRGGTFGMVATSETPRAASASAGATTSMRQSQNEGEDPNKLAEPKLLNEVERGALVEAFFTDGAPSMRMAISEPLSPPVSPRIGMSARGSSKAAKKWRRLSTTSRSRSQSLTSAAAVTPASQSPPDALSGAAPPAHTTAANTRSRSFSKASDDAPRNRVSREPTLVFIPPDHLTAMTSSSSPNINNIDNDSEDGALSIASNPSGVEGELNEHQGEEDIRRTHPTHNDVSLDATNPSSFATSALDATLNSATLAHSSSRKQQSSTAAGSVPSPNPRDPGRSAATSTVSHQANHLNLARKLLLPCTTKNKSTTKSSKPDNTTQHPQPAPSFEKQCTMMRGKQQERNRIYIEQRTRRLDGSSSPPPLLHAPKRSASTTKRTKRPSSVSVARPSTSRVPDTSLDASTGPHPHHGPESVLLSPIIKRPTSHINTTTNATTSDSPSLSKQPPIVFEL